MAKHKICFTERFEGNKDHTSVIVYSPDCVSTKEVVEMIEGVKAQNPLIPLKSLLDNAIPAASGWGWKLMSYDATIRLNAIPVRRKGAVDD